MLDRGSQPWEGLSKKPLRISGKEIGNQPTQQHLWTYQQHLRILQLTSVTHGRPEYWF